MAFITFSPKDYFNSVIYTGSGSAQDITVGFQPDLIWFKNRSYADNHQIVDRVRWVSDSNSAQLTPNENNAQGTKDIVNSFASTGFNLATGDRAFSDSNGDNFVCWNWKANGAGSTNNDGSTASTVSASTASGFSIVTHSGSGGATTIGHGLGVEPKVIISKRTSATNSWFVQQPLVGGSWTNENYIILNTDNGAAAASSSSIINAVTSSTISFAGSDDWVNASGSDYVHYVFAQTKGFSRFGTYLGNGSSTDGPYIYTGFKPAFLLVKKNVTGEYWGMYDNKRNTFNNVDLAMIANRTDVEADMGLGVEFNSNGIKIMDGGGELNTNGETYFYMTFAAEPLVSSNDIPATAR